MKPSPTQVRRWSKEGLLRKREAEALLEAMESNHQVWASDDRHTRIASRAYELYIQRGRGDGHDLDDWLEAEQDVLARHQ